MLQKSTRYDRNEHEAAAWALPLCQRMYFPEPLLSKDPLSQQAAKFDLFLAGLPAGE